MSSLKAINDTMNKVEEYTEETSVSVDRLDKNFQKWFDQQRRSALDAEEDRREAKKAIAAMGAAGRAGQSGNQGQQQGGPGLGILPFLAGLPPAVKALLGITAGAALYKTGRFAYKTGRFAYRAATLAPLREGSERLGQRTFDAIQRRRDARDQIAAAERAEAERLQRAEFLKQDMVREQQARIQAAEARERARINRQATALTDVEYAADKAAEEARIRRQASRFTDVEYAADKAREAARLRGQTYAGPGQPLATANVDGAPSTVKSYDPATRSFVPQRLDGSVLAKDLIPNIIQNTNRVRLTDVITDAPTLNRINDIETKNNVRISVTPEGKIDIRSADPSKPGAFVSQDVFNKTMVDLTSADKPRTKPVGKISASPPGFGTALGLAGLVLEAGDIASQTFKKTGATSVVPQYGGGGAYTTTAGALTMGAASEVARLPGDLIDLGVLGFLTLTGRDGKQTQLGNTIAEKVFYSSFAERLKQQGGVVDFSGVGGQTVLGTADQIGGAAETAVDSVIAGLELLSGSTPEEIKAKRVKQTVDVIKSIDPTTAAELATVLQTPYEQQQQAAFLAGVQAQIEAAGGIEAAVNNVAAATQAALANAGNGQGAFEQVGATYNARAKRLDKMMDGVAFSGNRSFID